VEIKCQLDAIDVFIANLIACSTCFGHRYAHHQELKSIIQVVAACGIWCCGFQVVGLVWSCGLCVLIARCCASFNQDTQTKAPHQTDNEKPQHQIPQANHLYNTLDLLMMGIAVPETC